MDTSRRQLAHIEFLTKTLSNSNTVLNMDVSITPICCTNRAYIKRFSAKYQRYYFGGHRNFHLSRLSLIQSAHIRKQRQCLFKEQYLINTFNTVTREKGGKLKS